MLEKKEFSPAEYGEALAKAESFLQYHAWLNKWSFEKGRLSFHVMIKFHTFYHLVQNSQFAMC